MLSMPTFWAASVTVRPEARQVQAVSSFRSERKRAGEVWVYFLKSLV